MGVPKIIWALFLCISILFFAGFILLTCNIDTRYGYRMDGEEIRKPRGKVKSFTVYTHDLDYHEHKYSGFVPYKSYEYDAKGYLVREIRNSFLMRDNITGTSIFNILLYKNDKQGHVIELTDSFSSHHLCERYSYTYNEKGEQIKCKQYCSGITIISINDPSGKQLKKYYGYKNDFWYSRTYLRDKKGNLIDMAELNKENCITNHIIARYDTNDNLIEECDQCDLDNYSNRTLTYKYDNTDTAGNWLKRITFQDDKPVEIKERKIEYY